EFQILNVMSSAGASILGAGYLLPMAYLVWSLRYGKPAVANPWGAEGLEWQTSSPPPTENFLTPPSLEGPSSDPSPAAGSSLTGGSLVPQTRERASPARAPVRQHRAAKGGGGVRAVGLPRPGSDVLRRPLHGLRALPVDLSRCLRRGEPPPRRAARHHQHGGPHLVELHHGPRGPRRRERQTLPDGPLHPDHPGARL